MTLLDDGAALRAHLVGPAGRVAARLVFLIAFGTFERRPQPPLPALRGEHPLALLPRRPVTQVLAVAALEERDPVAHVVLLEADDRTPHAISLLALRIRSSRCGRRGAARAAPSSYSS